MGLASILQTNCQCSDRPNALSVLIGGELGTAFRKLLPVETKRDEGIFFSGTELSATIAANISESLKVGATILDPACGSGDLLLACADYLPTGANVRDTLVLWSDRILGYDVYEELVNLSKLRLTALAMSKSGQSTIDEELLNYQNSFRGLQVLDVLSGRRVSDRAECVVVNPPFGDMAAPAGCKWGTGKVQRAGVFVEKLLREAPEGQQVVAILPDVLRSGARYRKWRQVVAELCTTLELKVAGRFSKEADVDVFVLRAISGKGRAASWPEPDLGTTGVGGAVVGDFFEIHVGPVVPHRHREAGPSAPYIHARNAPAWQTVGRVNEERKFAGRLFHAPFVVVHRTSSPSDKKRCVGTVINDRRPAAVENHLLVLEPKEAGEEWCNQLLRVIRDRRTDVWFNQRIRCRHLTVSSLKDLPWWIENDCESTTS